MPSRSIRAAGDDVRDFRQDERVVPHSRWVHERSPTTRKGAAVSGELEEFTLIGLTDCHKLDWRFSAARRVTGHFIQTLEHNLTKLSRILSIFDFSALFMTKCCLASSHCLQPSQVTASRTIYRGC